MAIVGAVGVEVLPQVRSFNRDMRAKLMPEADKLGQDLGASMGRNMRERLGVEMRNLPKANVGLDDSAANRQITELKAKLDALGRKHETATVSVNTRDAGRSIDSLTQKINGSGGLMAGLLALAPAAVPVGAAITGAIGATLPILTAAGAGFGAFGIAVAGSVKLIEADMKSMTQATQKVATAQAAVDNAKGPAARAAAQKRLNAATAQYNALLKQMSPAERTIIKDWGQLVQRFDAWDRAVGLPAIAKVAHGLFPLLNAGFKIMTPLVKGTANALVSLEAGANRALNGAFGKKFIKFLENSAPRAILGLGHAFSNIGKGIAGVILAFAPFQHSVLGALDSVTAKFATWGTNLGSSSGFHKFIQYVRENGPQLAKLLQAAGQAVVALVKAAAGFGAGELKTMTSVLGALVKFANAHPQVAKLAVATLALAKAVQLLKLASIGGGIFKLFTFLAGTKVAGGAASAIAGDAAGAGAAGAAARAGGLAARAGTFAAAVGGLSVTAVAGLLAAPIVAGIIAGLTSNKRPPLKGPGSLNPNGTPRIPGKVGEAQIDANNGGVFDPGQKGNRPVQPTFAAAPIIKVGSEFSAPPIVGPKSGLKKKGRGYELEGQIAIHAGLDDSFKTTGKKAKTDFNAAFFGNEGNSKPKVPKSGLPNQGTPILPPPGAKIKVAVLGADSAKTIIEALGSTIKKVPSKKDIKVAQSGAKTVSDAVGKVKNLLGGTPSKKQIKVAESGAKTAASAIGQVAGLLSRTPTKKQIRVAESGAKTAASAISSVTGLLGRTPSKKSIKVAESGAKTAASAIGQVKNILGSTPNKKNTKMSTTGAGTAKSAIAAIKQVLGQTPNKKDIKHSTPGAAAAHSAIAAIKQVLGLTPNKKDIKHSTPGSVAAHSAIAAIKLVLSQTPNRKDIKASTPGAAAAQAAIRGIKDVLAGIPNTKSVALKVIGSASDALSHFSFASGGHVQGPGGPRDDAIMARLSNNEFVQPAHVVQSEGVDKMEALRKGRATIVPKFADGGLVINTSDPGVPGMPRNIKGFLSAAASHIGKDQEKHLQKALSSLGSSGGGGAGANSWIPVVAQALALLHQPIGLAALWARSVIANESGGNALAVNRTDINAQHGTPSVGGNQVIGPTFAAYAGPFRNVGPFIAGVSVNRLANTFAALNYALHAYGSIANVPGVASLAHGGGYRPYATGGPVPGSGNGDTVPAMLTPGEFVLNKGAVSKVGMGILHAINGGGGTGDGFFHAGGPVLGIHYGAVGDWVKALAIQSRQLRGAFHQSKWDSRVSTDVAGHPPVARSALSRFDPIVKRLVSYLWGRHGKATTFDDALGHFNHGEHPMAFLDIMRAYDAGKGYLTEFKGKGKGRHRFIPDSTLSPFRSGLRRYEGMYHHDVQALEHKLHFKPENGTWSSGLDGPVAHVIDHALHKAHSQFLPRPWSPLNAGEKTLQQVLKSNADTAELNKDLNKFIKWGLFDLVENLSSGNQDASMLPTARAAAKNRGLATKLNAAYKVADRTTGINPLVNLGYSAVKYDQGGYIQPGHTMVINKTNKPEPVLSSDQWDTLKRGGSRPGINIEHVEVHDGSDVVAFGRQLAFTLANAGL